MNMKRTLQEDLERIHSITYGKQVIQEGLLDDILKKVGLKKGEQPQKVDDPKKADLVSSDVNDFFLSLDRASKGGGLSQQSGGITYQKEVESLQIGLMLLGYDLPRFGVDGLFGPETAAAVTKFTNEKVTNAKPLGEAVNIVSQGGGIIGRPGQGTHNASDWQSGNAWDVTGPAGTQVFSITNGTVATVRQGGGGGIKRQGVKKIYGDQLRIKSSDGKPDVFYTHIETSLQVGDNVKEGDVVGTIMQMPGMPSHVHVGLESGNISDLASGLKNAGSGRSSAGGTPSGPMVKATPEMINVVINLLKERGVKSEELKKYIDSAVTTGGGANFTDLDLTTEEGYNAYAQICQRFIDRRKPNLLGITGEMMAIGAKGAFTTYKKYVPPELALAQLAAEGGIGNGNANSRPIRTRNPFNVGNTDSGANVQHNDVQSGINTYYNLIAKDYLVKGKTAADLVQHFVNKSGNRYATAAYEPVINKLAGEANRIAAPVYASLNKPKSSDTNVA
jgi:murein DD-endopeptidase MepM/ murein hydrolase activator NlpD